jgi:serine O-acetyltransferase
MITDKKSLREYIDADLAASYVPHNAFKRWLHKVGGNEQCNAYSYVRRLRLTEYYLNTNKRLLYHWSHFLLGRLGLRLSIRIAPNCVDKGLCIIHLAGGGGIFVNAEHIGEGARFQAGVVVGNKGGDENRPTIGKHVGFGLGCKVYGKITIGDNVSILPNAVVTHDVPANAIVGGIPAKVIRYKEKD